MKESRAQIERRMSELDMQDFDWNEWFANERDMYYMYEKITGIPVTDETYCTKIDSFKECIERDPNFKKTDE